MKNIVYLLLLNVFLFSCRKEKTTWDSNWTIPVINDTITLDRFVNDSTMAINSTGYYEIDLHRTLLDVNLIDLIKIPDTTIYESYTLSVSSLTIPPGTNFVNPSQVDEHDIDLKDVQLKKIRLKEGKISLKLKNVINTKTFFTVTLPGVSKNGIDFQHVYAAPAGNESNPGIIEETIDISGYYMDLTGANGGSFNKLQSFVSVKTDPQGPSVVITNNDITRLEATIKDLKVDYARGYLGNQIISDTTTVLLDALSKLTAGSINLPATILKFNISNGLKIPAKATLYEIKNENFNFNSISLTHPQIGQPFYLDPATGTWENFTPSQKTIEFNSTNSNIENFLENIGAKNTIGYAIQLNPWGNVSGGWNEVFPNSHIKVTIDANLPLTIGLDGLSAQDTFNFSLKQNEDKSNIESGKFIFDFQNAFPMQADFAIDLLDANNQLITTLNTDHVIASSLYGNSINAQGLLVNASKITLDINENIIHSLNQVQKLVIRVILNTPNPSTNQNEMIMIPEGAFIGVKIKTAFKLKAKI
ncbi:MAG: hypothetical protein HYR91_15005 [Flavobacteriia bacterium]|nr:hypothetical protein [Flavobacteriia bacterium]